SVPSVRSQPLDDRRPDRRPGLFVGFPRWTFSSVACRSGSSPRKCLTRASTPVITAGKFGTRARLRQGGARDVVGVKVSERVLAGQGDLGIEGSRAARTVIEQIAVGRTRD